MWGNRAGGAEPAVRPSTRRAAGGWRDWWTVLHPPYTAWTFPTSSSGRHSPLASISRGCWPLSWRSSSPSAWRPTASTSSHGRPLRTLIPGRTLVTATVVSLAGAVAIGVAGVVTVGVSSVPFHRGGSLLVLAYNAELFGG